MELASVPNASRLRAHIYSNLSALSNDIFDTTFWKALTDPYTPPSPQRAIISVPETEDASPLESFIVDSHHLLPDDCGAKAESASIHYNSSGLSAEQLRTQLWEPSGKWAWISGRIPKKTVDQLVLKERKRYNVYLTTCEIENKAIACMSKCWPISPHAKAANHEIQLFKKRLNALQGVVVPNLIHVFIRPGFINVAFEPPHDTFWIEASSDMPSVLKRRCLDAFQCLHARGILHGAVDFSSILVGGDGRIYITDFESSRPIASENVLEAIEELDQVKYLLYSFNNIGRLPPRRPRRHVVPGKSSKELEMAIHKFLATLTQLEDTTSKPAKDTPPSYPPPSMKGRRHVSDCKDMSNHDAEGEGPVHHGYSLRKRKATTPVASAETPSYKRCRTVEDRSAKAVSPSTSRNNRRRSGKAPRIDHITIHMSRNVDFRGDGIIHDSILANNLDYRLPIVKVRDFGLHNLKSHPMHTSRGRTPRSCSAAAPAFESRKRARENDYISLEVMDSWDQSRSGALKRRKHAVQPTPLLRESDSGPRIAQSNSGWRPNKQNNATERVRAVTGIAGSPRRDSNYSAVDRSSRGRSNKQHTVESGPQTGWWGFSGPDPAGSKVTVVAGPSFTSEEHHYVASTSERLVPVCTIPKGTGDTTHAKEAFSVTRWMNRLWSLVPQQ